jgi:hypothetical protein
MRWTRLSLGVRSELTSVLRYSPWTQKLFITKHANGVLFKANRFDTALQRWIRVSKRHDHKGGAGRLTGGKYSKERYGTMVERIPFVPDKSLTSLLRSLVGRVAQHNLGLSGLGG